PLPDTWTATSMVNAPGARTNQTGIWTGGEMIVWGGYNNGNDLNTGGRYNPNTDTWIPISTAMAPAGRASPTAVWTGNEMIVGGGRHNGGGFNNGGRYNPRTDSWIPIIGTNAPQGRWGHTAVWTGSEMIVWGGGDGIPNHTALHTGGRYNPATDTWTPTSIANAPVGRTASSEVRFRSTRA